MSIADVWPQLVWVLMIGIGVGNSLGKYGQPKKPDTHDINDVLIGPLLSIGILYAGGFFKPLGWG